jgi:hypothetical protein
MPSLSDVGNLNDDNEKVKGIILSYLYEKKA